PERAAAPAGVNGCPDGVNQPPDAALGPDNLQQFSDGPDGILDAPRVPFHRQYQLLSDVQLAVSRDRACARFRPVTSGPSSGGHVAPGEEFSLDLTVVSVGLVEPKGAAGCRSEAPCRVRQRFAAGVP